MYMRFSPLLTALTSWMSFRSDLFYLQRLSFNNTEKWMRTNISRLQYCKCSATAKRIPVQVTKQAFFECETLLPQNHLYKSKVTIIWNVVTVTDAPQLKHCHLHITIWIATTLNNNHKLPISPQHCHCTNTKSMLPNIIIKEKLCNHYTTTLQVQCNFCHHNSTAGDHHTAILNM